MNVNKNSKLYKDAFYEVFKSIQLSGSYVLYYDIDLSKEEMLSFHDKLRKNSDDNVDHKLSEYETEQFILKKINFNCREEAAKFPYRAKLKMSNMKTKPKTIKTIISAATDAIGLYLVLAVYTLVTEYNFDEKTIQTWFYKLTEFGKLYGEGLTDEHVFKYFLQECDLKISEE